MTDPAFVQTPFTDCWRYTRPPPSGAPLAARVSRPLNATVPPLDTFDALATMLICVARVALTGGAATLTATAAERDAANWALPGQYSAHEREVESPTA